jgi:phage-related protein
MSPDEVLDALRILGVNISRSTLLRFEKAGMFTPPRRGAGGRGQGRFTEYDNDTPKLIFATWMLMKTEKISLEDAIAAGILYRELSKKPEVTEIRIGQDEIDEIANGMNLTRDEWQAIMKYLDGGVDFKTSSLLSAQKQIGCYLDKRSEVVDNKPCPDDMNETFTNWLFEINLNEKQRLARQWGDYYSLTKRSLPQIVKEIEILNYEHKEYLETIEMLEEENKKLREVLIKHGIKPD